MTRGSIQLISSLRIPEIIGRIGFALIGGLLTFPSLDLTSLYTIIHCSAFCLLLGLSIYAQNSYFGFETDQENKRLSAQNKITKRSWGILSASLSIGAFAWAIALGGQILVVSLLLSLTWLIYALRLKQLPYYGVLIAFVGQILLFQLGHLFFDILSFSAIWVSLIYALFNAAGHLIHEITDHNADKNEGFKTTAIVLGGSSSKHLALFLFGLGILCALTLSITGHVHWTMPFLYGIAYILQLLDPTINTQLGVFRKRYLMSYFLATMIYLVGCYIRA